MTFPTKSITLIQSSVAIRCPFQYMVSGQNIHNYMQGRIQNFEKRGAQNYFYKLISTMWHFNVRIFMPLSTEFLGGQHV